MENFPKIMTELSLCKKEGTYSIFEKFAVIYKKDEVKKKGKFFDHPVMTDDKRLVAYGVNIDRHFK